MEKIINNSRLEIIQGDITVQATEAIVNAANSGLMGGGGVDGAIHQAGGPSILEECKEIIARQGRLPAGQAVITTGGNLKARYVIHTVGPVWRGGRYHEPELLAGAYRNSLELAVYNKIKSISFPSISTGAYNYPVTEAARIALKTVYDFLVRHNTTLGEVIFVLYGQSNYRAYEIAFLSLAGES